MINDTLGCATFIPNYVSTTSSILSLPPYISKPKSNPKLNSNTLFHALVNFIITYSKVSQNPLFMFYSGLKQEPNSSLHLTVL